MVVRNFKKVEVSWTKHVLLTMNARQSELAWQPAHSMHAVLTDVHCILIAVSSSQ